MSISVYTGTPGSGKTLHAVADIRDNLNRRKGPRPVLANFDVDVSGCRHPDFQRFDNSEITPKMLCDFADAFWDNSPVRYSEDYLLLVLDECSLIFNSRNWMSKGTGRGDSRMDWLEFMSQHRKYGYRIILIAQSAKMIDNQFRMLCDDEINHRRVDRMGTLGALLGMVTDHRLFMLVHLLFQTRERLGWRFFWRTDDLGRMYDTNTRLKQVTKGQAGDTLRRGKTLKPACGGMP